MSICTEPMFKICPYGTYVLLGSLKRVLRGQQIMKNALKELEVNDGYVQWCDMNSYDVLVLCPGRWDSVFTRLLLWTVDVKFLGFWKNFVLANAAAPNAEGTQLVAWDELTRCIWCVFLLIFIKKSPNFTRGILKFVTEGSLPWRFQ